MTFRYLESPEDPSFAGLLKLYHGAFPKAAREPDGRLVQELRREFRLPFRFLVVEGASLLGFARFCRVPEQDFGYLVHIATDPGVRGAGVGTELLQRCVQQAGPILAEVDRVGPVREWYEKRGFVALSETYTQPALRPDTPPLEFALMVSDSRKIGNATRTVTAFYESVWELRQDHPFVQRALQGVAE